MTICLGNTSNGTQQILRLASDVTVIPKAKEREYYYNCNRIYLLNYSSGQLGYCPDPNPRDNKVYFHVMGQPLVYQWLSRILLVAEAPKAGIVS